MAFHFSLESMLRLRRGRERMELLKLEAISSEQAETRTRLEQLALNSRESRRRFQQTLAEGLAGSELQFEAVLETQWSSLRQALLVHFHELERRRQLQVQVYLRARQQREILENLRQRRLELYRIDEVRRAQQQLDDLFLMRQGIARAE